jgi:hypothetical protein
MEFAQAYRLRESLAALRVQDNANRPVCVRLDAGTVVLVMGDVQGSGLVDVRSASQRFSVFAEDLIARSERVLARAAGAP